MQIKEIASTGLKREYDVTVSASDIEKFLKEQLETIGKQVKMPGFRPGKIPLALLKQRYESSALKEVLEDCLNKAVKEVVKKFDLTPALRPNVEIKSYDVGKDLELHVSLEVFPVVGDVDLKGLTFKNYVVKIPENEVTEALSGLAKSYRKSASLKKDRKSVKGDIVLIDFEGTIGKDPIEGGSGKAYRLELGSGSFIPGFEDQLIGHKKGDDVDVKVRFPKEYHDAKCADKEAHFKVKIKDVQEFEPVVLDDAFAAELQFESLEKLREVVKERLASDYKTQSALNTKRHVLDALAEAFPIDVPQGLVDIEFGTIWEQLLREVKVKPDDKDFAKRLKEVSGTDEKELRETYRHVAERRVCLGILLAEFGKRHNIKISGQDLTEGLIAKAKEFPGQEREVVDFYRNNEDALASLRAPLFEQKVIEFILSQSTVKDVELTPEEFEKTLTKEEEEAEKKVSSKKKETKK